MGLFGRSFRVTPKEELDGIKLNLNEHFWELKGQTDFPALFRALTELVPEDSILYFEGGSPSGQLLEYLKTNSISEKAHVAVGTLWPRPDYYHIPATAGNISSLVHISETIAGPELAVHFHIYYSNKIILQWHDAFSAPMLLSGKLDGAQVRKFADKLSLRMTRWENASEQSALGDAE
jgi:hypothetical protein